MSVSTPANKVEATYLKDYQPPIFFIDSIDLQIDLYDDYTLVSSQLQIKRNPNNKNLGQELLLNGEGLILEAVYLNDKLLASECYQQTATHLLIKIAPTEFTLKIVTRIFPHKNTALTGLYQSQNTYCTQCEAEGFRRITYYLDRPDVLATFTTKITADKKTYPYLLSNGNLIEKGDLVAGRHYVIWHDPFRKPCYLFALVAGDFDVLADQYLTISHRQVALRIYVEKGYGDQATFAMSALKEAMRWDEHAYGREYDLDIYMIVAIGAFNMGAMENKGLNIFNTKYILAKPESATDEDYLHILSVIGHEYFHNWSGNRVTCRDWFQLSLKEGLTIFRDQSFSEDLISAPVIRIHEVIALRETQFPEDAGPLAHSVQPDHYIEINNFYTTTIYNKGAEILRMLQTILGKTLFRQGMDLYFSRYDGKAVTIEDFIHTMEEVSQLDLTQFRRWYVQAGTPMITIEEDYNSTRQVYTLTIHQMTRPTPNQTEKLPQLIPIRMGLLNKTGKPLALQLNNETPTDEKVLLLTETTQMFQFQRVPTQPIPSFLRHFSAPVKLQFPYAEEELLFLAKHDSDPFNRYEASQQYAMRIILQLIKDYQQDQALNVPETMADLFTYLIEHESDHYLLAESLTLPSEKYIGEQMSVIDVDAIFEVRKAVSLVIAQQMQTTFYELYNNYNEPEKKEFAIKNIATRQLKNRALYYLMLVPQHQALGFKQFDRALGYNMTDTQSALASIVNIVHPQREQALQRFYDHWRQNQLVTDKWFALQAGTQLSNALQQVKNLKRHAAFDIKNPNKVYALIGTFGYRNRVHFHARNGEGYAFLRETVAELDKLNPQVAARMCMPLMTWQRYDNERQTLMRMQLEKLLQDKKISPDLFELVSKSLKG